MAEVRRVGLYSTPERRDWLSGCMPGAYIDWRDARIVPFDSALAAWAAGAMDAVVVDDRSVPDKTAGEAMLLNWAASEPSAPRTIVVADPAREADDPFFFQLVSLADVKDIIFEQLGMSVERDLPRRLEVPTRLMEVSYWKTDDRRKLVRAETRKGPLGALARRRERKEKERIMEKATEIAAQGGMPQPATPMPASQEQFWEQAEKMPDVVEVQPAPSAHIAEEEATPAEEEPAAQTQPCPICGQDVPKGQRFCGACGADTEQVRNQPPTASAPAAEPEPVVVQDPKAEMLAVAAEAGLEAKPIDIEPPDEGLTYSPLDYLDEPLPESNPFLSGVYTELEGMRAEEPAEPEPVEMPIMSAAHTIAVTGAMPGCGCTHLACALAYEAAGKGARACVALFDEADFIEMRSVLAPEARTLDFEHGGVVFFPATRQPKRTRGFDVLVADCGEAVRTADGPGEAPAVFSRAQTKVVVVPGSPWDLAPAMRALEKLDASDMARAAWYTFGASEEVSAAVGSFVKSLCGSEVEVGYIPFRPKLFFGDRSKFRNYEAALAPALAAMRSVDPADFGKEGA